MGADLSYFAQPIPAEETLSFDDVHEQKEEIPTVVLRPARVISKRQAIVAHKPDKVSMLSKLCKPLMGSSSKTQVKTGQQCKLIGKIFSHSVDN